MNPAIKEWEDLNCRIRDCDRCALSRTRKHALVGEGNRAARVMLIALSPGAKEDMENNMFIGRSGKILDTLLQAASVGRGEIYMTNLIKCILPKNRKPRMVEIFSCAGFLYEEISIIQPEVIVPLGYYASRTILQKYHAPVPLSRCGFSSLCGQLYFADDQKIFPLPHPSSLLYRPSFEAATMQKYEALRTLMQPCKWFPVCPMKHFYETGRLQKKWIELYCKGDWRKCVRREMEEQGRYHPDWMLPDGTLDESLNPQYS
ncbi:MAG: uracil-DNA glycosylase [Acidobacteria bacterium]|nr:uracil-DNA glycosylase [Acidobacteriota bacterium]